MSNGRKPGRFGRIIARTLFVCMACSFIVSIVTGFSLLWIGITYMFLAPLLLIAGLSNQPMLCYEKLTYEKIAFALIALTIVSNGIFYILKNYNVKVGSLYYVSLALFVTSLMMFYFALRKHLRHVRGKNKD